MFPPIKIFSPHETKIILYIYIFLHAKSAFLPKCLVEMWMVRLFIVGIFQVKIFFHNNLRTTKIKNK